MVLNIPRLFFFPPMFLYFLLPALGFELHSCVYLQPCLQGPFLQNCFLSLWEVRTPWFLVVELGWIVPNITKIWSQTLMRNKLVLEKILALARFKCLPVESKISKAHTLPSELAGPGPRLFYKTFFFRSMSHPSNIKQSLLFSGRLIK